MTTALNTLKAAVNTVSKTYWASNGMHQQQLNILTAMVPSEGPVANARKRPHTERFRKAMNCYYDLYNNGLGNRAREFSRIYKMNLGIWRRPAKPGCYAMYQFDKAFYDVVDRKMDEFIRAALMENGIINIHYREDIVNG